MACVFSVPTLVLARSAAGGRERQRLGASSLVGRETTRIPTVVRLAATTSPPSSDPHRLRFHILSGTDGNIIFTPIGLVQHHCIIITLPLGHYFLFFCHLFSLPQCWKPHRGVKVVCWDPCSRGQHYHRTGGGKHTRYIDGTVWVGIRQLRCIWAGGTPKLTNFLHSSEQAVDFLIPALFRSAHRERPLWPLGVMVG